MIYSKTIFFIKTIIILFTVTGAVLGNNLPYVAPDDPMLQQTAKEIPIKEILAEKNQKIIDSMMEFAIEERKEGRMVGLAAPQVGIPWQIILVDMKTLPLEQKDFSTPPKVFINPKITWKSKEIEEFTEGCFSTGTLVGIVPRHKSIKVEAYTRNGKKVTFKVEGYTARIFQHEVDHLHGLRFPDRLKGNFDNLHWVKEDEIENYRANFKNWQNKCSKDEWISFINQAPKK